MTTPLLRRGFLAAVGATAAACQQAPPDTPQDNVSKPSDAAASTMPKRALGKTGVQTSIVGLGGFHMGKPEEEAESIRIVHSAIDHGITFMDNCWDYNGGKSEERMGKALAGGYRDKVFLMTKLDGRSKPIAMDQLEQSLKRLRTDVIDLVQIHEVIRPGDPATCFAEGGCMEALVEAKKAGKIRFIGFTGHKHPDIHLAMLAEADKHGFVFDTVQMPLNVMDAHFRSFEQQVLPQLVERKIGVLGMKPIGSGHILKSKTVTAVECLHYAMNLPTSVVITGCESVAMVEQAVKAALDFRPMSRADTETLLSRTREAAKDGDYEKFKTGTEFDGTEKNPHWLTTSTV